MIASATIGATLRSTVDGTTPSCNAGILLLDANGAPTNAGTVAFSQSTTFQAIACKPGYAPSAVTRFVYVVDPAREGGVDGEASEAASPGTD